MNKYTLTFLNPQIEHKYQQQQEALLEITYKYFIWLVLCIGVFFSLSNFFYDQYTLSILIGGATLLTFLLRLFILTNLRYFPYIFGLQSLIYSCYSLLYVISNNWASETSAVLDITFQISVCMQVSQNYILNLLTYVMFLGVRITIHEIYGFSVYNVLYIVMGTFYIVKEYVRTRNVREAFLLQQMKYSYEEVVNYFVERALLIATYNNQTMKFESQFRNQMFLQQFKKEANEFFKEVLITRYNCSLQYFLFKNQNPKDTSNSMNLQIIYQKRKYQLELLYLSDSRFAISVVQIDQVPMKIHPLYRKLLQKLQKINAEIFRKEMLKLYVLNLFHNNLKIHVQQINLNQIIKLIHTPKILMFRTNFKEINTDCRLLQLLFKLFKKPKYIQMIRSQDDLIRITITANFKPKNIVLVNKILELIGVGVLQQRGNVCIFQLIGDLEAPFS